MADVADILAGIRDRRVVVILGDDDDPSPSPQPSMRDRRERWTTLAVESGLDGIAGGANPALIAQCVRLARGRMSVVQHVRQMSNHRAADTGQSSDAVIDWLASIATPLLIVTTRVDNAIEQAFERQGRPYDSIVRADDLTQAGSIWHYRFRGPTSSGSFDVPRTLHLDLPTTPVILHVQGMLDLGEQSDIGLVIDENDIAQHVARSGEGTSIPAIVQYELERRRFLFLGFGLDDWPARLVLHRLARRFRDGIGPKSIVFRLDLLNDRDWYQGVVDALMPHCDTASARRQLLERAFGPGAPLIEAIDLEGAPRPFVGHLLRKLWDYGTLPEGDHVIDRILSIVQSPDLIGADGQARIQRLRDAFMALPDSPASEHSWAVRNGLSELEQLLWANRGVRAWNISALHMVRLLSQG